MVCDSVKVRAPGSVMLFGEHAVLASESAMVTAIDQYMTVTVEKREDDVIDIHSNTFPPYKTSVKKCMIAKPYHFVLACLQQQQQAITQGLTIQIDSDIDPTLGLGSSAAVTIAILTALHKLFAIEGDIWTQAHDVIRTIQGQGSGMDALASLHGGVLYFDAKTQQAQNLSLRSDLHLLYCGYKTPTAEVLQQVRTHFQETKPVLQAIYRAIGAIVPLACHAWQNQDNSLLARCMTIHHELQQALTVSDAHSERLCQWLKERVGVDAVKISGSGLGDCLLALGGDWRTVTVSEVRALHPKACYMPLKMSAEGVTMVC